MLINNETDPNKMMSSYSTKLRALDEKIVNLAQTLIPVLKDAARPTSAGQLEALFFEREALSQEMQEFIMKDPGAFIAALTAKLKKEEGK